MRQFEYRSHSGSKSKSYSFEFRLFRLCVLRIVESRWWYFLTFLLYHPNEWRLFIVSSDKNWLFPKTRFSFVWARPRRFFFSVYLWNWTPIFERTNNRVRIEYVGNSKRTKTHLSPWILSHILFTVFKQPFDLVVMGWWRFLVFFKARVFLTVT